MAEIRAPHPYHVRGGWRSLNLADTSSLRNRELQGKVFHTAEGGVEGRWGKKPEKSDGRGGDNLLACAHPKCAKSRRSAARAHCFLVCQVFRVLRPSGGHAIVTRSRATARQSRRSNALLLCIVLGQIKERGTPLTEGSPPVSMR